MKECFKCGISENLARLSDVIYEKGIVYICSKCLSQEDLPVIRKAQEFDSRIPSKPEFLSHKNFSNEIFGKSNIQKDVKLKKQETTLRDVVERNLKINPALEKEVNKDMIDNFHWIIMRARRSRKITQEQLAREIMEPEPVVKMAEKGVLPDDSHKLISKLENYLGVRLFKKQVFEEIKEQPKKLDFDSTGSKILTISDLKDMKQKKEDEIFEKPEVREDYSEDDYVFNEEVGEDEPEFVERENDFVEEKSDDDGISKEEMDRILFGK